MRVLIVVLLVAAAVAVVLRLAVPRIVHRFVYFPARHDATEPGRWGLPSAETVWLVTADEIRLHAWWLPAPDTVARRGAAVYFHGNGGDITGRGSIAEGLAGTGLDVLMLDYRGYGASRGTPDEAGFYRDATAAYRHVREERDVDPDRIVLFGESLGAAVAVELATREPVGALVLVGPLTSTVRVARAHYPFLPDGLLEWDRHRFDALARIDRVRAPLLLAHGSADRVVPPAEANALYQAANEPKRQYTANGYGHNDIYEDPALWRAIRVFVERTLPP